MEITNLGTKKRVLRGLRSLLLFALVVLSACNDMAVSNTVAPIPYNVQASTSYDDRIDITWSCSGSPETFAVYRAESPDTEGKDYQKVSTVTGMSYTDPVENLIPGKMYYYRIASYARSISQKSEMVGVGNVKVPSLKNIKATDDQKGVVQISWDIPISIKSSAVEGYVTIYYSENSATVFNEKSVKIILSDLGSSYYLKDVVPGQEYHIRAITSVKGKGTADILYKHSEATDKVVGMAVVTSPKDVVASKGIYQDGIYISWSRVEGVLGFRIYREEDRPLITYSDLVADVYQGDVDFINRSYMDDDSNLKMGQGYRYAVKALVNDGTGMAELELNESRNAKDSTGEYENLGYKNYDEVTCETITTDLVDSVFLRYQTNISTFVEVYGQLYRRSFSGDEQRMPLGEPQKINNTTFTFADTTVVPGKKYYYSVVIYRLSDNRQLGASGYSKEELGYSILSAPQNLIATDGTSSSRLSVSWDKVAGALRYDVYIGSDTLVMTKQGSCQDTIYWLSNVYYPTGKVYYFRVKAYRDIFSELSVADAGWIRIEKPTNFQVVDRDADQLELSWNAIPNAQEFVLQRKVNLPEAIYDTIDTIAGTVTNYHDIGLSSGVEYAYKLQTVSYQEIAPDTFQMSEDIAKVVGRTLLRPPVLDSVSQDEDGYVKLAWTGTADVKGVKYQIHKFIKEADGVNGEYYPIALSGEDDSTITISNFSLMLPGEVCEFVVTAIDSEESSYSNSKDGFSKLDTAFGLTATMGTISDTIRLHWYTNQLSGIEKFIILRREVDVDSFVKVGLKDADLSSNSTEYIYNDSKDLSGAVKYQYKIESYREDYIKLDTVRPRYSNIDTGMIKVCPPDFHSVDCGTQEGKIFIHFKEDAEAQYYLCYYSTRHHLLWCESASGNSTSCHT